MKTPHCVKTGFLFLKGNQVYKTDLYFSEGVFYYSPLISIPEKDLPLGILVSLETSLEIKLAKKDLTHFIEWHTEVLPSITIPNRIPLFNFRPLPKKD